MDDSEQLFKDFINNVNAEHDGVRTSFKCKLGLWSVEAKNPDDAFREAMHYFQQYRSDGEYDGTAADKLLERLQDENS